VGQSALRADDYKGVNGAMQKERGGGGINTLDSSPGGILKGSIYRGG
jgi:hypothetical protein